MRKKENLKGVTINGSIVDSMSLGYCPSVRRFPPPWIDCYLLVTTNSSGLQGLFRSPPFYYLS